MSAEEVRPLLAFGTPQVTDRPKQKRQVLPRLSKPTPKRQGERLGQQFNELIGAFDNKRLQLSTDAADDIDPALVVVFDLAGSVKDFCNAIDRIDGMEFLSEFIGDNSDPDDDFHMTEKDKGRTKNQVPHSLYLTVSNVKAIDQLLRLFNDWQTDPKAKFPNKLGKFKDAFKQLTAIRRWGPEDRIRETGLLEQWQEHLDIVGQSSSSVMVEVELWYRPNASIRAAAQKLVERVISDSGGHVHSYCDISEINYHALLAELPIQLVHSVLTKGAESIKLLATEEVMFVNPFTPMSIAPPDAASAGEAHMPDTNNLVGAPVPAPKEIQLPLNERIEGLPRVALLDGYPLSNHDLLTGRLTIDDPDDLGKNYPVENRYHGTAMASLIIHGDLSADEKPLDRLLYVRPIMRPHEVIRGHEEIVPDRSLTDLLHQAIKRIVEGEAGKPAEAPSVRIINLSIGSKARALVRRMSPVGRLLDWLASTYNLLFIVSAGNYLDPVAIPVEATNDVDSARAAITRSVYDAALLRGILSPGDALNVLTVGATHSDGFGEIDVPDTVWDVTSPHAPAHYSATGPGVNRSVKPDLHHTGGRAFYTRPLSPPDGEGTVEVEPFPTHVTGPGLLVAAPGQHGSTGNKLFSFGTSNATALVTREASRLFDILEHQAGDEDQLPLPDAQYHPLLVRALLAHASSWAELNNRLRSDLELTGSSARRHLTTLLGYGRLDTSRLGTAAINRAVVVGAGHISRNQRHAYELPLPPSLRTRKEWHRFTITLSFMAPTFGRLNRYRGTKVYFATPDTKLAGGERAEAEHHMVRRGSLQHEIIEGTRAMVFGDGDTFPIHVECMDDAKRLHARKSVRYALVVSVETKAQTSSTIHDEVRTRLRQQVADRSRVQP